MRNRIFSAFFLLALLGFFQQAYAKLPETVEPLIKKINLPGDSFSSLAVDMKMNPPLPMHVFLQVRYCAPDSYALNVFDGYDLTPVLIVRGNRAMVNDPFSETVSLVATAGVSFEMNHQNGQLNANFAFTMPTDGKIKNRVNMDFNAIFAQLENDLRVATVSHDLLVFSGATARGNQCIATISPKLSIPLQSTAMFIQDSPQAILDFPLISADSQVASECFAFPASALENSGLPFDEARPDGMIDTMMVVATVMKAIFSRIALRNPELRQELEARLQFKPDWEKARKADAVRSAELRKIFKPFD